MLARAALGLLVVWASLPPQQAAPKGRPLQAGSACKTKAGDDGVCARLTPRDCPWAINELRQGRRPAKCAVSGAETLTCCPASSAAAPPAPAANATAASPPPGGQRQAAFGAIAWKKCQEYAQYVFEEKQSLSLVFGTDRVDQCAASVDSLIVKGTKAKPREFPHMALIGFGLDKTEIEFMCGGSLISPNFVLTAGHCITVGQQPARWVLLGELDRSTDTDNARPQLLGVEERVKHPGYSPPSTYHDIGLLRLVEDARLSGYVRPACLYAQPATAEAAAAPSSGAGGGMEPVITASGWGDTTFAGQSSDHLMKVALSLEDDAVCAREFQSDPAKFSRGILAEAQLCAGGAGGDTCQGDSGGPLQVLTRANASEPYCMYKILGVTSFGKICGFSRAAVYTRVRHYVPWIESVVWPA